MVVTLSLSVILMLSLLLMIYAAVAFIQSKKLFTSAPKDIQEAVTEHEERFPGARVIGWVLLIIAVLAFPGSFIYGAWDGLRNDYGLLMFFIRFLTMLYLMKAFDIIFLDWFLLTKSHFYQHYFPETEGCAGYHSFGFNRKEQLSSILFFPFLALLFAWICTLL